jgi:CheY-like chemotaxis protein
MPTSLRGKHVLVVDDDPDIVDLIKFVVLQAGATVRTATGATEALNLLVESEWVPDVVLLDIGMPDMNGYELLLAIRRQDGIQSVPAVASPDSATTSTRIAPSTWGFRYTSRSHSSRTCWSISSGGSPKRGLPPSVDPWPGRFVPLDPLSQEGGRGFVSHPTGITPLGHVHEVSWGWPCRSMVQGTSFRGTPASDGQATMKPQAAVMRPHDGGMPRDQRIHEPSWLQESTFMATAPSLRVVPFRRSCRRPHSVGALAHPHDRREWQQGSRS